MANFKNKQLATTLIDHYNNKAVGEMVQNNITQNRNRKAEEPTLELIASNIKSTVTVTSVYMQAFYQRDNHSRCVTRFQSSVHCHGGYSYRFYRLQIFPFFSWSLAATLKFQ